MARRTFSITMSSEAQALIDEKVKAGLFPGRSRAIEHYVLKGIHAEQKEREILSQREGQLQQIWALEQRKLDFLLAFFSAADRKPGLIDKLREALET